MSDHLNEDFPLGDGTAQLEATVSCPYCGEIIVLGLDPGGGATQEYVEDCQVCCRPWAVRVQYQEDGSATVEVRSSDDE